MSVTETLAAYVVDSTLEAIPRDVRDEATRALVNYLGCALGGSIEPALDVAIQRLAPFSGERNACVLGRAERFDALNAALLNGIGSHVHEYDDTLPKNYIHPSVPVGSALFAYASANPVAGRDFVHAFILGFEVESRIGNAVYPAHYQAGWHITSTTGVFGAAAAVGKLFGLTTKQMVWAFGLAATQAAGIREMFGSMAKSFQPGRAAQNGYTAALLGRADFTAGERALEGPRGFAAVTAARVRPRQGHGEARRRLRAARQRLQAVRVRARRASCDRRLQPAAPRAPSGARGRSRRCACASRRSCSISATRGTCTARSRASTRSITRPLSASFAAKADSRNSPTTRSVTRSSRAFAT